MREMRKMVWGSWGTIIKAAVLLLVLAGVSVGRVGAANYGTWTTARLGLDNALTYSATPIMLGNADTVRGFAYLAHGFHLANSAAVTFQDVAFPVASDIYLGSSSTLTFTGDLTLSTTVIRAGGNFTIGSNNTMSDSPPVLFLEHDTNLPSVTMSLSSSFTIDGLGHTVTFASSTVFSGTSKTLTLRNMVIKFSASGTTYFTGITLKLQNCIIDIPSGVTVTSTNNNGDMHIINDVMIRGGGTFKCGNGSNTYLVFADAYATLYVDHDTTFDYASTVGLVNMDNGGVIHINGGTLKVDSTVATSGMCMFNGATAAKRGCLILENNCILDNGTNTDMDKGFVFGTASAATDLNVKVLAGARVQINGCVYHKPA